MTINIGHLYYDILNLYGESGNIKIIKNYLENLGINVNIKFITLGDSINLDDIDLLYIGSGTLNNQDLVLNHLKKYKDNIKNFIENNKYVISTGNSIDLFSKNKLGIFDYESEITPFRIVDEVAYKCNLTDKLVIGFQNRDSIIKNSSNPLFEVIKGVGSYPNSKTEGYTYKNFYSTYLIGPLFVRNPYLLTSLMNKMIKEKDNSFDIKDVDLSIEVNAYNEFIKNKNL